MTPEEYAELNGAYPDAPNNPTPSTTGFMDNGGFAWAGKNAEEGYDFQKMTPSPFVPFDQIGTELQQQRMEGGPMLEPTNANFSAESEEYNISLNGMSMTHKGKKYGRYSGMGRDYHPATNEDLKEMQNRFPGHDFILVNKPFGNLIFGRKKDYEAESFESEWVIEAVQQNLNDKDFVDYAYGIIVGGDAKGHDAKSMAIAEIMSQNSNNGDFTTFVETEVFNAEIEDVTDSMAVIRNKFDDMVGAIEVDDDKDDNELVEVSIQDDELNEVGSYTLDDGVITPYDDYDPRYSMMAEGKGRQYWLKDIQFQGNAALASLEGGNPFYPYEGLFTSSKAAKADLQKMLDVAKTLPEATIIINDDDTTRQYTHWNNNVEQILANASYKWRNTFKGTKDRIGWHGFTVWLPYGRYNITYKAITKLGAESAFDNFSAERITFPGSRDKRLKEEYARNPHCRECGSPTTLEYAFGRMEYVCADDWCDHSEPKNAESAFDKLEDEVAEQYEEKGMSDEKADEIGAAVAYKQGVKKYGKKIMTEAAKKGVSAKSLVKNTEEPIVEYPDWIPAGDGNIVGQQNSAINMSPLHAENTVGSPSPTFNEDITGQDGPETEPTNSNFSAESGISWGKLFIGSAALILGGGLLANKQGWVGSAEGDDEPKEDESMITDNEPTLVENPNTGDLLRGDYEEMVVQSTGYAVPVIPMSLDGSFMGSRFQALPTDRYVDYNEPGIGAHTDVAMERNTKYLTPAAILSMNSEDCGCGFIQKIKAFFTGESCGCNEETDVKESQGVGQSPYFQMGKEPVDMDYRVIKEVSPKGLDPAAVQYMPTDWVGQTGQAYVPDSLYGTMYDLGVAGINPTFNTPNESSTGANRMGDRMAQPDTLSNVVGPLSVGSNASYTDGGETKTLAQWGMENQVSQISDSEAVVVSHTSGVRKMIRRV